MTEQDVRWLQRFSNYRKALGQLTEGIDLAGSRELSLLHDKMTGEVQKHGLA